MLRRLRLEWKNFADQENAEQLIAGEPWTSRVDRKTQLQRIARDSGLTEEMVSQVASSPVAFRTIVRTAAAEAPRCGITDVQAEYCWMAASGIAHAQRWAVMSSDVLQRQTVPGAPEGSVRLALSISEEALIGITCVGSALTMEGWRVLSESCRGLIVAPGA